MPAVLGVPGLQLPLSPCPVVFSVSVFFQARCLGQGPPSSRRISSALIISAETLLPNKVSLPGLGAQEGPHLQPRIGGQGIGIRADAVPVSGSKAPLLTGRQAQGQVSRLGLTLLNLSSGLRQKVHHSHDCFSGQNVVLRTSPILLILPQERLPELSPHLVLSGHSLQWETSQGLPPPLSRSFSGKCSHSFPRRAHRALVRDL